MGDGDTRDELDEACDEHERLTHALASARARQQAIVTRFLDGIASRLAQVAGDLSFGFEGARASGIALARGPEAQPLFLLARDESWTLIERRAHGMHAVVERLSAVALLDAFGRDALRVLAVALHAAGEAARTRAEASRPSVVVEGAGDRGARTVTLAARVAEPRPRTRECPHCDAQPNAENFARHLRTVHGLVADGRARKRS